MKIQFNTFRVFWSSYSEMSWCTTTFPKLDHSIVSFLFRNTKYKAMNQKSIYILEFQEQKTAIKQWHYKESAAPFDKLQTLSKFNKDKL